MYPANVQEKRHTEKAIAHELLCLLCVFGVVVLSPPIEGRFSLLSHIMSLVAGSCRFRLYLLLGLYVDTPAVVCTAALGLRLLQESEGFASCR